MTVSRPWQSVSAEARSSRGVVAAGHRLAAEAGAAILAERGNAVDALVAAAFMTFVVEPHNCGVGGYGRLSAYVPERDQFFVVDHHIRAPRAASDTMFEVEPDGAGTYYGWPVTKGRKNNRGGLAVGVPGAVAGLVAAHEELGRLPLAAVLEPAIAQARLGVEVDWELALSIGEAWETINADAGAAALLLVDGGPPQLFPPQPHRLELGALAETLQEVARHGDQALRTGDLVDAIVAAVQRRGGVLSAEDLATYRPKVFWEKPARFGDLAYVTADDAVAYEALGILQSLPYADEGPDGAAYRHAMAEALAASFTDNMTFYGDPQHVAAPAAGLRDIEFARARARDLSMERAAERPVAAGDPWPFENIGERPVELHRGSPTAIRGTSQVAAADETGLAVSLITTISGTYGSGVFVEEGGFFLNNGMQNFDPRPSVPNSITPGKMPIFAAPALVAGGRGRARFAAAGSGGYRIESGVLHTTVNHLTFGMELGAAAAHPRVHSQGRETFVDARIPVEVHAALTGRGHDVVVVEERPWPVHLARVSAVARADDGELVATSWPAWSGGAAGA